MSLSEASSIAPETAAAPPVVSVPVWRRPLPLTLLLALLAALSLQLWRPYFHLTDDNLSGGLPVMTELAQRLWSGKNPAVIESLFGGGFQWTHDVVSISNVGPYNLLFSWVLLTSWKCLFVDLVSTMNLVTIAGAFAWSALALRRRLDLTVSDGWIVLLSLSYAFTPYNFAIGASWCGFINPQASAPVMLVGLLHPKIGRGIALVAGGMLYAIFGGHLHPFIYLTTLLGLLTLLIAATEKNFRPLLILAGGAVLMVILASPLLVPAFGGFQQSQRSVAMTPEQTAIFNIPIVPQIFSFVLGPLAAVGPRSVPIHFMDPAYNSLLLFTLVNVPIVWMLVRKRSWKPLELSLAFCAVVVIALVSRPPWMSELLTQLPLFRSLRWPFREIPLLFFFTHLLLLMNLPLLTARAARLATAGSALLYATTFLNPPPSFNLLEMDRQLVLRGVSEKFWADYVQARGSRPMIVVSAHPQHVFGNPRSIPYSLLSAYNFAAFYDVTNIAGYAPSLPFTRFSPTIHPWHHGGLFTWEDGAALVAAHPELVHVSLRQIRPPIFTITDGGKDRAFFLDLQSMKVSEIVRPPKAEAAPAPPAAP